MPQPPSTTELHDDSGDAFAPVLIVAYGPPTELGRRFPVVDVLPIGRNSPSFANASKTMSRDHCELKREGANLIIRDLESRKGTFVNGERIQKRVLAVGDVIGVGDLGLVVAWAPLLFVPSTPPDTSGLAYASLAMARAVDAVRAAARTVQPLALVGEPGVGKRVLAELLHRESAQKGKLIVVDGAIDEPPFADGPPSGDDTVLFSRMSEAAASTVRACVEVLRRRERKQPAPRIVIALGAAADGTPVVGDGLAEYFDGSYVRVPSLSERVEDILPIARQRMQMVAGKAMQIGALLALRLLRRRWTGNVRGLVAEVDRALALAAQTTLTADVVEDHRTEELRAVCRLARDGSFIESAFGERTSLEKRRVLRALVKALVDARARNVALDAWQLAEVCWPGEQMAADSVNNRVYVAVATLRKLGLGRSLSFADGGYRLADDESLRVVDPEPAT